MVEQIGQYNGCTRAKSFQIAVADLDRSMGLPSRYVCIVLLVGSLLTVCKAVKVDRPAKRIDRADHGDSAEDYDDSPSYEDDEKEKELPNFPPQKSKDDKDFFKNFKFDSSEFGLTDDGLNRRKSSFDWGDVDDDDFPDFKDFPDEPRESPSSGYSSHVSMHAGFPDKPIKHQYSITHPRSPSRKKFDFDDFDFNSKEEAEGAFSSKVQTPELPDSSRELGDNYGPLLKMSPRRHKTSRISSDSTNNVPRVVKFEPESLTNNDTRCFKAKKRTASSDEKIMTCYMCFDENDEKIFERCYYDSEPKKRQYGRADRRAKELVRKKREIFPDDSSEVGFGFEEFNLGADSSEYFSPEFGDEDDPDRRRSGGRENPIFSDSLAGRNCLTTKKNDMTCIRCMDPNSNRLSEQCSYESDPIENSYEYSSKKSYGTPREPKINYPDRFKRSLKDSLPRKRRIIKKENSTESSSDDEIKNQSKFINKFNSSPRELENAMVNRVTSQKKVNTETENQSTHVTNSPNDYLLKRFTNPMDYEDKIWDVAREVNAMSDLRESPVFMYEDSGEVEKKFREMVGEFTSKDWSNCTLRFKGSLTCYNCKHKGVSHEECLHVSHVENPSIKNITKDARPKRYFLNKVSPKKFDSSFNEESLSDSRSKRLPRSPVEYDSGDRNTDYNHEFRPSNYYSPTFPERSYSGGEYDPEFQSHSVSYALDHDAPAWYHSRKKRSTY